MAINEAFILAGGKGERLKPLTDNTPKPLLKVREKPILEYNVEALANTGVKKIVLAIGYKARQIEDYFGGGEKFGVEIVYSIEKEFLGTGGALKFAEQEINGRFIMLNGDNLADFDFAAMGELHNNNSALGTIALVEVEDVEQYGVAQLMGEKIMKFVEKPKKEDAPSNLINAGAYILEKETIGLLPTGHSLIEVAMFPGLAEEGKLCGYVHRGQWFPTDNIERLEKARKEWKK